MADDNKVSIKDMMMTEGFTDFDVVDIAEDVCTLDEALGHLHDIVDDHEARICELDEWSEEVSDKVDGHDEELEAIDVRLIELEEIITKLKAVCNL